jgi:hypothetical protein
MATDAEESLARKKAMLRLEAMRRGLAPSGKPTIWPAPYDEDTPEAGLRFLTECCWTDNDADQTVELIPAKDYIETLVQEWHGCLVRRQDLILEKSRRMIASWVFRGLELWQAGLRRGNWLLCDQDYAQSAKHVWRYHWLLEQMKLRRPEMNVADWDPRGSLKARKLDMVVLANGSTLANANQEAGDLQGEGKTAIVLEEFSRYRDPARFWAQSHFLTQGKASRSGGWVCAICNASENDDWRAIKGFMSRVSPERCEPTGPAAGVAAPGRAFADVSRLETHDEAGLSRASLPSGVRYVNLHYSADADKGGEWVKRERASFATDREWLIEMEMQELNLEGKPVHPHYDSETHAPLAWRTRAIPLIHGSTYIAGHDCGTASLNPASVLLQITPAPWHQVQLIGELVAATGTSFEVYAPAFVNWIAERFPGLMASQIYHGGDETARARDGLTGQTAQEVARRAGFEIMLVPNRWADRRGAVDRLLTGMIDESLPRFVLSQAAAPICHRALSGGYRLRQVTEGVNALYGEPRKDAYSNPMDALQYAGILAWQYLDGLGQSVTRTDRRGRCVKERPAESSG